MNTIILISSFQEGLYKTVSSPTRNDSDGQSILQSDLVDALRCFRLFPIGSIEETVDDFVYEPVPTHCHNHVELASDEFAMHYLAGMASVLGLYQPILHVS